MKVSGILFLLVAALGLSICFMAISTMSEVYYLRQRVQNLEEKAKQFEQLMGH